MSENTMMLVQATWQENQTFRMIPISESCPYVECIMDPETKVFVIISKITRTTLQMLPRIDDNGEAWIPADPANSDYQAYLNKDKPEAALSTPIVSGDGE